MPTVSGPLSGTTGIVFQPVCFTGATAYSMRLALVLGGFFLGAILGLIIGGLAGLAVSSFTGPEPFSKPVLALIGALIGALFGAAGGSAYVARVIAGGTCTCPPGKYAYCICFVFFIAPGTTTPLPMVPLITACPASCALIPTC